MDDRHGGRAAIKGTSTVQGASCADYATSGDPGISNSQEGRVVSFGNPATGLVEFRGFKGVGSTAARVHVLKPSIELLSKGVIYSTSNPTIGAGTATLTMKADGSGTVRFAKVEEQGGGGTVSGKATWSCTNR